MATVARVETLLASAREARQAGDLARARDAISDAVTASEALEDPAWMAVSRWRLAKAAYDDGDPLAALDAVSPLLERGDPFADYPAGTKAVDPISCLAWDTLGYRDRRPEKLWTAWTALHRQQGDPFLAGMGEVRSAWPLACRGELEGLSRLLERWCGMTPRRFGTGPHRHPDAPDAESSVFWIQKDIARTVLRGATWAGAERLAWAASEVLEDAMEDTGTERSTDYWFLECISRAQLHFGWDDIAGYTTAWIEQAAALTHARAPFHRALTAGEVARSRDDMTSARTHFLTATHQASGLGPEWRADALREAIRCGEEQLIVDLTSLVEATDLHAFRL
jgi:hypothetical protein